MVKELGDALLGFMNGRRVEGKGKSSGSVEVIFSVVAT